MAGAKGNDIVYSGVGKSREDIRAALRADIGCFNVESIRNWTVSTRSHWKKNAWLPVSVRVNPDVDAKTHPYISTGLKTISSASPTTKRLRSISAPPNCPAFEFPGIDKHIGSQITELEPFVHAADKIFLTS